MDPLSDVLRASRLTGGVFLHAEFSTPWCIKAQVKPADCAPFQMEAKHIIGYHYIIDGSARIQVSEHSQIDAECGDVLLFPRNDLHLMGSDLSLPPAGATEFFERPTKLGPARIRFGGGGGVSKIICGFLGCDSDKMNPVLAALPAVYKLNIDQTGASEWIRTTLQFAADEIAAGNPGSATVLSKLSELLFVEIIRRYAQMLPDDESGWLAGLKDPYVARALAMLHKDIAKDWTVEELSRDVGLSRSAFADRFSRLIGTSPKQYLTKWRMQRAAQLLQNTDLSLSQIAEAVGYESDAAFSRAFKKVHEVAPATWRKTQTQ